MKECLSCGRPRQDAEIKCPKCGGYYSKIAALLIAEEEEDEEKRTFRGRYKRILESGDVKNELMDELQLIKTGLSKNSLFTIYVIIAFVFALIMSVL